MEFHMNDPSICHLKQLITSTLQIDSITSVIESDRQTTFDFTNYDLRFISFVRHYFSGTKILPDSVSFVVNKCLEDKQFYFFLVDSILCNEIFERYPTKKSYRRNILKIIITQLEENGVDIYDELYAKLADCMLESVDTSYRIYLNQTGSNIVAFICESNKQLVYGTTGLSVWQASCDLSDLLTRFINLSGKHVLELGAGCGLTGISVARTYPSSFVTLTDFDPKVLEQLKRNVDENIGECCSRVHVKHFDWNESEALDIKSPPDVVIAADVIYDRTIMPALCQVLRMCLTGKKGSEAYVASTVRDPATLEIFKNKLEISGLSVVDEVYYQHNVFTFRDGSKYRSCTLFPHSSTLDAPTVIYKISFD